MSICKFFVSTRNFGSELGLVLLPHSQNSSVIIASQAEIIRGISITFFQLEASCSLCNKRHELAENFLSLILINLVPKVASNCE